MKEVGGEIVYTEYLLFVGIVVWGALRLCLLICHGCRIKFVRGVKMVWPLFVVSTQLLNRNSVFPQTISETPS